MTHSYRMHMHMALPKSTDSSVVILSAATSIRRLTQGTSFRHDAQVQDIGKMSGSAVFPKMARLNHRHRHQKGVAKVKFRYD